MCNIEGKWFKTNLELFFFFSVLLVDFLFLCQKPSGMNTGSMERLLKYPCLQKQNTSLSINFTYLWRNNMQKCLQGLKNAKTIEKQNKQNIEAYYIAEKNN